MVNYCVCVCVCVCVCACVCVCVCVCVCMCVCVCVCVCVHMCVLHLVMLGCCIVTWPLNNMFPFVVCSHETNTEEQAILMGGLNRLHQCHIWSQHHFTSLQLSLSLFNSHTNTHTHYTLNAHTHTHTHIYNIQIYPNNKEAMFVCPSVCLPVCPSVNSS